MTEREDTLVRALERAIDDNEKLRAEVERLSRELKSEKEESASYHKFWIEARDAMHKLAEKDAL
jgi:cell division septum initiation protein DivIVA